MTVVGSEAVRIERRDTVAVVTIDHPPVNALGFALREPLGQALEALRDDTGVEAIVLTCAGRGFIAGADIAEFGTPRSRQSPTINELCDMLEMMPKPVVAAIHGAALGGGLEIALCCHHRVATAAASLGLPEVKLGLLPGAGGTVRLPRLVGPEKALAMILSGAPVKAEEALAIGLVDAVSDGDLVAEAVSLARSRIGAALAPVRDREDKLRGVDLVAFDKLVADATAKSRGLEAPVAAAQAVRNALTMRFAEAQKAEREAFLRLVNGDQSRAQRHLFLAEREAAKLPDIGRDVQPRDIRRVGVVGGGTMGGGIAMAFANGGLPVTIVEMSEAALSRGLANIEKNYAASVARGSLSEAVKAERMTLISGALDYAALSDCDLIVEAVFEDIDVKQQVFARLDSIAKPGAILATNTSYLDVNRIAASTGRSPDVLGLHFFSPAHVMKLLEIVRADETAPDVVVTALALARRIGKIGVVAGMCHGFIGNRMLAARGVENEDLLAEGATPASVDAAFRDFGFPMGPFEMGDLAGLDIAWRNRKSLGRVAPVADALCEAGRFGQKTGRGFYLYEPGSRTPKDDPEVLSQIEAAAQARGIARREIAAGEIIERTLYPMINEGFRILEEKIAARASDIDIVWTNGYGFPIGKGGPMFWAHLAGLGEIVERLEYWHGRTGKDVFKPARMLREAAAKP
ncbi:3-hydroxyacyl-CoA dehydrogenase NAD-binding domain-containing protein [Rhizobium sp.]